jgi:hypothetical protein
MDTRWPFFGSNFRLVTNLGWCRILKKSQGPGIIGCDVSEPIAALELEHLTVPPGNRLEALTKDRKGQHSIRVNDQFRVCFRWLNGSAHDVEIVDYH